MDIYEPAPAVFVNGLTLPCWAGILGGTQFQGIFVNILALSGLNNKPDFGFPLGLFQPKRSTYTTKAMKAVHVRDFSQVFFVPQILRSLGRTWYILDVGPLTVTVITRIISFLIGNPYKPSFPTGILWGGHIQGIYFFSILFSHVCRDGCRCRSNGVHAEFRRGERHASGVSKSMLRSTGTQIHHYSTIGQPSRSWLYWGGTRDWSHYATIGQQILYHRYECLCFFF